MTETGLKNATKQALIYAAALASAKLMSFVMVPIYTAWLSPEDYGRLDVLQTMANLLTLLVGMGMSDTLFRFAGGAKNAHEARQIEVDILGMAVVVFVLAQVIFWILGPWIAQMLPGGVTLAQTRLMLASIGCTGTIMLPLAWLRLRDFAGLYFWTYFCWMGLMAILSSAFLMMGHGVTGVMWSVFLAHIVMSLALVAGQIAKGGIRFRILSWGPYIQFGGPLILAGVAAFILGSFDRWLLADLVSTEALGHYVLAAKIAAMAALMVEPYDLWWLPRRFKMLGPIERHNPGSKEAHMVANRISFGLYVTMIASIGVAATGPLVIQVLTPPAYHPAMQYVPWIVGLVALNAAARFLNMGCHAGHSTMILVKIDGLVACIAVIGYFIAIPAYGVYGTIAATFVALIIRLFCILQAAQQRLPLPLPKRRLAVAALLTAIMMVLMAGGVSVWHQVLIGGIGVTGLTLLLICLHDSRLSFLNAMLKPGR